MKTIAVINQKGGVGKSTTAHAIGAGLSLRGFSVLFVDLDAQGNLSYAMGANTQGYNALGILQRPETARAEIEQTEQGDIIASTPSLSLADKILEDTGKEYKLREALEGLEYDYCIIDTPPALGILTVNALTACDGAIIPTLADIFALQGIGQLSNTIHSVRKYCNPSLEIMGILLTQYNSRSILSKEVASMTEQTAAQLNTKVYQASIRVCSALREAQAIRQSIFEYDPKSNAAADYNALIDEILGGQNNGK